MATPVYSSGGGVIIISRDDAARYGSLLLFGVLVATSAVAPAARKFLGFGSARRSPPFDFEQPMNNRQRMQQPTVSFFTKYVAPITKVVRALSFPALTVGAMSLLASPATLTMVQEKVPALLSAARYSASSVLKVLPPHPRSMTDAFEYGQLTRRLLEVIGGVNVTSSNVTSALVNLSEAASTAVAQILSEAAALAGRSVTAPDLLAIGPMVRDLDAARGPIARILSMLTLANITYLVGLAGVLSFVVPFVAVLCHELFKAFRPLIEAIRPVVVALVEMVRPLAVALRDAIVKLLRMVLTNVVVPVGRFLRHFIEPLCYAAAFYAAVESSRYALGDPYSNAGAMVAILAALMHAGAWVYTTSKISSGGGDARTWASLTSLILAATMAPLAILHNSKLLGYATVMLLTSFLGFGAASYGLCIAIGFDDEKSMMRVATSCLMMSSFFVVLRGLDIDPRFLAPFESAATVFGSSVYFLALLIVAHTERKLGGHAVMIANLIAYGVSGEMLGLSGLSNVAKTYGVLYAFTVGGRTLVHSKSVVGYFCFSVLLVSVSFYITANPVVVSSLLLGATA